jgi:hypothetical protein
MWDPWWMKWHWNMYFSVSLFGFPLLITIPSLLHTHISPSPEMHECLEQAEIFKAGTSSVILHLADCRVKKLLNIECSLRRLIRRPEHLIGRHCGIYRQTEGHSFGDHLISASVSVTSSSVTESSIVLRSVSLWLMWVNVQSACAVNTQCIPFLTKQEHLYVML